MTWTCALAFGLGLFATVVAAQRAEDMVRREAVEAGVGRYVADPKTGQTRFEFFGGAK